MSEPKEKKYWYIYICDEWTDGWIPVPYDDEAINPINTNKKEG